MSWIKNLAVIIGITITPLLILDAYFLYDKLNYRVSKISCDRALTNYDYCPSITELRYMSLIVILYSHLMVFIFTLFLNMK